MQVVGNTDKNIEQPPYFALGFILAGGRSRRMGTDKAQLKIGEQSMLAIAQSVLAATNVNQHVVVGGTSADITEQHPDHGPAGAIGEVMLSLPTRFQQTAQSQPYPALALFIPVDMPCLTARSLNQLLDKAHSLGKPVYYREHYLPLVLPVTRYILQLVSTTISADPSLSVRKLLAATDAQSQEFEGEPVELANVNRPDDLQLVMELTNSR